jgi:hypothetical protein
MTGFRSAGHANYVTQILRFFLFVIHFVYLLKYRLSIAIFDKKFKLCGVALQNQKIMLYLFIVNCHRFKNRKQNRRYVMGDLTISIEKNRGELFITKVIGDRGLIFRFDKAKNRAALSGKFSLKSRLYSSEDLWVPRPAFIAACRQATAIFRSRYNKSQTPPAQQLQPAPALAAS